MTPPCERAVSKKGLGTYQLNTEASDILLRDKCFKSTEEYIFSLALWLKYQFLVSGMACAFSMPLYKTRNDMGEIIPVIIFQYVSGRTCL